MLGYRRADETASYVHIDNVAAADGITTHLISLGRRCIGHITGSRGTVAAEDGLTGYEQAMGRAGLSTDGLIAGGDFNQASGLAGASRLLERGVDALFCGNDATAAGALEAIRTRRLRAPEDVAVAGFDDLEFAASLDPLPTTLRQGDTPAGKPGRAGALRPPGGPGRGTTTRGARGLGPTLYG